MADKVFTDGLIVKRRENAPDFVIGNLSVKVDEFVEFLQKNSKNGWVNINLLKGKTEGKFYGELDTWEPNKGQAPQGTPNPNDAQGYEDIPMGDDENLPF